MERDPAPPTSVSAQGAESFVCWLCQGVGHLSPATHADDRLWGHECYECDGTGQRLNDGPGCGS